MLKKLTLEQYEAMRDTLRGIQLVAAATGDKADEILERLLRDRIPPGSARAAMQQMPRRLKVVNE